MFKKFYIIFLASIAIIFSLFALSIKVIANPDVRAFRFAYVCCGAGCNGDKCLDTGKYVCCIPED